MARKILFAAAMVCGFIGSLHAARGAELSTAGRYQMARIERVIDGDTVITKKGWRVRYIGIDTPETRHPRRPEECMEMEATRANRNLVEGKLVILESDVKDLDRYGRKLRYVYLPDEKGRPRLFVNAELAARGLAQARFYPPDILRKTEIRAAERRARRAKRGIWKLPPSRPRGKKRGMVLADPTRKLYYRPRTQPYEILRCLSGRIAFPSVAKAQKAGYRDGIP
jgi:micrococcal nuclease